MEVEDRERPRVLRSLVKFDGCDFSRHLGIGHSEKELVSTSKDPHANSSNTYRCQFNYLRTFGITIQLDVDDWHHCSHSK